MQELWLLSHLTRALTGSWCSPDVQTALAAQTPSPKPSERTCRRLRQQDSPAQDHVVIKEIDLDVLQPDGLVEALWDQEPEEPPQVWSVEKGHADLLGKPLQQRDQHCPGILPAWETQGTQTGHTMTRLSSWLQGEFPSHPLPFTRFPFSLLFFF